MEGEENFSIMSLVAIDSGPGVGQRGLENTRTVHEKSRVSDELLKECKTDYQSIVIWPIPGIRRGAEVERAICLHENECIC